MAKNNYATKNTYISDAEKAEWGISAKPGTVKQIKVVLNNKKSYDYLTRFESQADDVVVIGNAFAWQIGCCADPMETTGEMGSVSEIAAKVSVKRNHAAEIDFVFTRSITKKSITAAAAYINTEANASTLQYDKETENIYPLTYSIRKMFAAATILAFSGLASAKDIASAKAYIHGDHKFTDEVYNLSYSGGYFPATIWLSDDHYSYGKPALSDLEKSRKIDCLENGKLESYKRNDNDPIVKNEILDKYVSDRVHIGAVSLMIRGGFSNLLEAYLKEAPPIGSYVEELIAFANKMKSKKCEELIKQFIKS